MTMSYDPLAYEMPWRPNYEKKCCSRLACRLRRGFGRRASQHDAAGAILLDDGDLWRDGDGSFAQGYQTSPAPKSI